MSMEPVSVFHSGGSRIVAPDGTTLASLDEPEEGILYADLDLGLLRQERQNFDPTGHYARPDIFRLKVDRRRLSVADLGNEPVSLD